jgi:hypothetical protein
MNALQFRFGTVSLRSAIVGVALALAAGSGGRAAAAVISFADNDGGWTAAGGDAFAWSATGGEGGTGGWVADAAPGTIQTLSSPAFTVVADGPVSVSIRHAYRFLAFNDIGYGLDGGQLRYSVDGGPWLEVEASLFTSGEYQRLLPIFGGGFDLIDGLEFTPGWSSVSGGGTAPAFIDSVVSWGSFEAGQTVQVQFRAGWTNSALGSAESPNWMIAGVTTENLQAIPEPHGFVIGASLLLGGFGLWRRSRRA